MKTKTAKKLTRSKNRIFGGVLGGIAEYLNWDPTFVRIGFVLLALASHGIGLIVYLILWTIIPNSPTNNSFFESFRQPYNSYQQPSKTENGRKVIKHVHEEDEPHQH